MALAAIIVIFEVISLLTVRLFIVFGGTLAYIPQYLQINMTDNAEGFSIYVSLALITASCIKLCYWFRRTYDTALFAQSIVNIATMLAMLDLRVRVMERRHVIRDEERRSLFNGNLSYFWDWTDMLSYVQAITLFILALIFVLILCGDVPLVLDLLAYAAAAAETAMTMPQLMTNFQRKSTEGLSRATVSVWVSADVAKVGYLAMNDVPFAWVLCGILQLCVDTGIALQILYYGEGSSPPPSPFGGSGSGEFGHRFGPGAGASSGLALPRANHPKDHAHHVSHDAQRTQN